MAYGFDGSSSVEVSRDFAHPRRYWSVLAITQSVALCISIAVGFRLPFGIHQSESVAIVITFPFCVYQSQRKCITVFVRIAIRFNLRYLQPLTFPVSVGQQQPICVTKPQWVSVSLTKSII